jgi:hydroxypyruvate isomerase
VDGAGRAEMSAQRPTRRACMTALLGAAIAPAVAASPLRRGNVLAARDGVVKNGRLKQSVSRWPYNAIPLPDFCKAIAEMGLTAIDLLEEGDWAVARDHGLTCSMGYAGGGSIRDGLNVTANHDAILRNFERSIPRAAAMKVPNVITFFGNRRGMSDEVAVANCVAGLNRVKKIGEDNGVTICVELLNSKVNHPDYQGDRTAFGVAVVKAVSSPRVKLLYDIYHMQIMEGDLIKTIRDNREHIAHFHTGGVPGRHELDGTQEVNWPAVCRAIVDTGFSGYVAHEFVPTRDPLTSLREAIALCDV